jgi:hypothetical protein
VSEYERLTVTPQPAALTANPNQAASPPPLSAAFAVGQTKPKGETQRALPHPLPLQRVITNLLHLQPLRKVKSILSRPCVGTASVLHIL